MHNHDEAAACAVCRADLTAPREDAPDAAVTVALSNLIGNAVKYTQQGEVVVRLGDNAVDVIDSGPGLSAEDAARLFERGYRGSHAEHTQGGGIGLSIVRRLCALYGWRVRVVPGQERGVIATLHFRKERFAIHPWHLDVGDDTVHLPKG